MKKEKIVKSYQRKTKSGKVVTVKSHTASYDAADKAMEISKKAGAGDELKKKKASLEASPLGLSKEDFKEWYHWDEYEDPNNEGAKRAEKALKKMLGASGYKKYYNEQTDNYSARGHVKAHKALLEAHTAKQQEQNAKVTKAVDDESTGNLKEAYKHQKTYMDLMKKNGHLPGGRNYKDSHKDYWEENKKILDSLKDKTAKVKQPEELEKAEETFIRKNNLRYQEDGVYSSKDGKSYRLTTHPITGEVKMHPLIGESWGATGTQLMKARGKDGKIDRDKLSAIIWGTPKNTQSPPRTPEKHSESESSLDPSVHGMYKVKLAEAKENLDEANQKIKAGYNYSHVKKGKSLLTWKQLKKQYEKEIADYESKLKETKSYSSKVKKEDAPKKTDTGKTKPRATNNSKSRSNKKVDIWTVDKKISHVKSLMEKLSAEDRKTLSPFVKKASTGQLPVDDLYRHYMKVRYKGVRSRASAQRPPWDSRNSYDLRHSE